MFESLRRIFGYAEDVVDPGSEAHLAGLFAGLSGFAGAVEKIVLSALSWKIFGVGKGIQFLLDVRDKYKNYLERRKVIKYFEKLDDDDDNKKKQLLARIDELFEKGSKSEEEKELIARLKKAGFDQSATTHAATGVIKSAGIVFGGLGAFLLGLGVGVIGTLTAPICFAAAFGCGALLTFKEAFNDGKALRSSKKDYYKKSIWKRALIDIRYTIHPDGGLKNIAKGLAILAIGAAVVVGLIFAPFVAPALAAGALIAAAGIALTLAGIIGYKKIRARKAKQETADKQNKTSITDLLNKVMSSKSPQSQPQQQPQQDEDGKKQSFFSSFFRTKKVSERITGVELSRNSVVSQL